MRFNLNPVTSMWPGSGRVISNCQGSCARGAGMPSHAARLQRACACDPSCAVACLWARPGSCAEKKALALSFFPQSSKRVVFCFPLLLSPCWPVGGIFQVERDNVCFCSALCDLGGIMYHGRKEQQTDAKTRYRRQYVKKIKNKQNTKTKKQQTKTRQPYENVGREPQKSSQGSRGWVPFVNLIRKTTGQSDPECKLTAPI